MGEQDELLTEIETILLDYYGYERDEALWHNRMTLRPREYAKRILAKAKQHYEAQLVKNNIFHKRQIEEAKKQERERMVKLLDKHTESRDGSRLNLVVFRDDWQALKEEK